MLTVWEARSCGVGLPLKKLVRDTSLTEWVPVLQGDPTPPRWRPLSPLEEGHLRRQAADWLAKGVVEKTRPLPWVNNPVFVEKKNGNIRTCIDCRPVNAVTQDYDWPLPRLQDLRHRLRGARWFARMDLSDAFFRIRVPAQWRPYTAFRSDGVTYQFTRMPFGLKTAPAVFQRYMDHSLKAYISFSFWYIDDVLVFADTLEELKRRVTLVKRRLQQVGSTINEDKSEYDTQGLLFAGMWIYYGGQGPNFAKVRELAALPVPRTKKDRQSALGLVSYLRDHVPLASMLTASLTSEMTKDQEEHLEKEWRRLVRHIGTRSCTLGHWAEDRPATVYTDASGVAAAAILIQDGRVIALASRKLTPAETRYSATDREHLSLLLAAKRFRIFLHRRGAVTDVYNDHAAHVTRRTADMTPRQTRWHHIIGLWIPTIRHVKGVNNPADYLSRMSVEVLGGQIAV